MAARFPSLKSAGRRRLSGGRGFSILQTASAVWELPIAENARICYDTPMRGNYGMTTVIIGGGAAGMAAAITAAENGQRVTVLERNRKPLKKLGVTGNGRANVLNAGAPVYYGDTAFALAVLQRVGFEELCAFFASLGVPLRVDAEGRVYPAAMQAAVVVEALLLRARQLGVVMETGVTARAVRRAGNGFVVQALQLPPDAEPPKGGKPRARETNAAQEKAVTFPADRVVITVGGAAAPAQGTDGSAYGLLTAFGHRVTPLTPALCALLTDKRRIAGLAGQRVRARLAMVAPDGRVLHSAQGEVLFGEDAVSGIAAMQLARFFTPGATVTLDLRSATGWRTAEGFAKSGLPTAGKPAQRGAHIPALEESACGCGASAEAEPCACEQLPLVSLTANLRALAAARGDCALADLLTGTFAAPVAKWLCREAGLPELSLPIARLTEANFRRLSETIACLRLPLTGTRGFEQAQVTAGGVETEAFDPATMESRLQKGLFAAGEVLNVDGDCGGFNLMFAFASGILAGRAR